MLGLQFLRGLSLVTASGGHSSSRCRDRSSSQCAGLSPSRPLPLRGTGSRRACSVVVAHGLSCSAACGIFPDQGSNPRPLHRQADSQPLRHQGSPPLFFKFAPRDMWDLNSLQWKRGVLTTGPPGKSPLLSIYPKEIKSVSWRVICTLIFIAALFTVAKTWKQLKCLLTDEWLKQM